MTMTADQMIFLAAAKLDGVCTRKMLLGSGVSRSAVDRRVKSGLLVPVRSGVYVLPELRTEHTDHRVALAAVPGTVLARESAAQIHELVVPRSTEVHVVGPKDVRALVDGVVVHQSRRLPAVDVTTEEGLPATTAARTIVDLASEFSPTRLAFVLRSGIDRHPDLVAETAACHAGLARRGVPGIRRLRAVLAELLDDREVTASELERRFLEEAVRRGLTSLRLQFRPPWYEGLTGVVDFAHVEAKVIIETDGRRFHQSWSAQEEDRRRDRDAARHGWLVIRVTWNELVCRPGATIADVREIIEGRLRSGE